MPLQMRSVLTHYVDFKDLEQFIQNLYGVTYEIVAAEEASNDSNLTFDVDGKIQDYELADMRELMAGKSVPFRTGLWLNILCLNEEIPAGTYSVEICW